MKNIQKILISFFSLFLFCKVAFAQTLVDSTKKYVIISAGPEYKSSSFHQWLWGKNYRKEWTTPVKVPVLFLDTAKGGLAAYKAGGGHQTKSLHVKTKDEKEYALRSVDKSLSKVIPPIYHHTFIEKIVTDEISMSHPYAAVSVSPMEQSANIYHTNPQYVYLPKQAALDSFNKKFGNTLYLFEQRLSGNWKDADNLGNFKKFYSTDEIIKKLLEDNEYSVDEKAFVKARLFDMFIGDWDRHEDQWAWGEVKNGSKKIYEPIPQDRDQAYFKFDGVLLKLAISAAGLKYFQSFNYTIPNIKTFNYEERNLDRLFTNETTLDDWQNAAKQLQQALTDNVIETSLQQLPPQIFAISGKEIIAKLKARRNDLVKYATEYYLFLAKEVEVVGTKQSERFEINRVNENETQINLFKTKKDTIIDSPFYARTFKTNETKEIRLYGLEGNDIYKINGTANNAIKIRIIGGIDKDSIIDQSKSAGNKIHVYDNYDNYIQSSSAKPHLSKDTTINSYKYAAFSYDKNGFVPSIFYSNEDRVYIGLGFVLTHQEWRKYPFASKQFFDVHYSISQKAFSANYNAIFPKLIGKWDFTLNANYDAVRWTYFFGLGNESQFPVKNINYYTMRTEEWLFNPSLNRRFGKSIVNIGAFFQSVRIINDTDRFIAKNIAPINTQVFTSNRFAGAQLSYNFLQLNDSIAPTKGIAFSANIIYTQNLNQSKQSVTKYAGNVQFFIPFVSKFSFAIEAGAATVTGNPLFYQYASIGGGPTLRGFRRDRFWGKTTFYNSNELRYIGNLRTHILNGKAGALVFFDDGRVWMPSEISSTLHTGYGAGIFLAPFNKISGEITYGISTEERLFQVRIYKFF
ncbi:MAG: ShlB/FhaC/HecB family hemolysin secretion/activation protein [Chitinophagaceae bacterium]